MSINPTFPLITMELYETDIYQLQKFLATQKIEGAFTEEYLILFVITSVKQRIIWFYRY